MPIKKEQARIAAANKGSTSTHEGNAELKFKIEEQSDQDLTNNMLQDMLTDPEDYEGGSTHSTVVASTSTEEQNVGTLPTDIDPAAGYVGEKTEAADPDSTEGMDDPDEALTNLDVDATLGDNAINSPVPNADEALENNFKPNTLEGGVLDDEGDSDGDDVDWDPPPPGEEHDDMDDFVNDEEIGDGLDEDMTPEGQDVDLDEEEELEMPSSGEDVALLDIDETPDTAVAKVLFASVGTNLLVLKGPRVIATMTKSVAKAHKQEDVYLSDQFQQVVATELGRQGLRKGLKSMGFTLATVNVAKNAVVATRVKEEVTKTTAALRRVTAGKEAAFSQALTIAAVGMNRKYFDQPNELKAALETSLTQAGVRNAGRMLHQAFAAYGPAYAKSLVELATKIAAMPKESRDGFVTALDMTSEDLESLPEGPDEAEEMEGEEGEGMDGEFFDDTVTASLSTPGRIVKASAVQSSKHSVTANKILSGEMPMFG